ncbi:MAG: hypothetical protein A2Z65_07720 [Gallionellales bacterium RIFCSPLOWO2_02_58_13]|nr:MAG: hypothetical protein A2Z65_07720 [Gallionellales bacterium RIFCSPLOWO2_02_58_13]
MLGNFAVLFGAVVDMAVKPLPVQLYAVGILVQPDAVRVIVSPGPPLGESDVSMHPCGNWLVAQLIAPAAVIASP